MTEHYHPVRPTVPADRVFVSIISNVLNIPPSRLSVYTHFFDDLYLDDTDMTLLVAEIEQKMHVYLSPEEVKSIETITDIKALFQERSNLVMG